MYEKVAYLNYYLSLHVCLSICLRLSEWKLPNGCKYQKMLSHLQKNKMAILFFGGGSDMSKMDQTWLNACKTCTIFLVLNKTEQSFIPTGCTKYDKMYVTFNIAHYPLQIFTALFPPNPPLQTHLPYFQVMRTGSMQR